MLAGSQRGPPSLTTNPPTSAPPSLLPTMVTALAERLPKWTVARRWASTVAARKPMVECAVDAFEAHVTTFIPGRTGCLECLVPEIPPDWRRRFPVLGAVSGTAGCLGAVEVVKLLTGLGEPLAGVRLVMDLGTMEFRRLKLARRMDCPVCGDSGTGPAPS